MRLPTAFAAAPAVLALAACGTVTPQLTPTPPPTANLTVGYSDNHGSFYMSPGQTLLVKLSYASSGDTAVLALAGRYTNATLFKAAAEGRRRVTADLLASCNTECNAHAPFEIVVVVVTDLALQQGVTISEQDQPWNIHLRSGQPFVVTLQNRTGSPPWARLTSADQKVIVPEGSAVVSAGGIEGRFQAGEPGRSGIEAAGPNCPPGAACPQGPLAEFTVQVFI